MTELATHLLTHTLERLRADLALLESVGCISAEDMRIIQERLPRSFVPADQTEHQVERSVAPTPTAGPALGRSPPPPPPVRAPVVPKAEAKWDYDSGDTADLSFKAGDVIEIVEETSEDWWVGRLHGKQGMFPSNRCIKLEPESTSSPNPAPRRFLSTHSSGNTFSEKTGLNKLGLKAPTVDQEKKDKYEKLKGTMANSAAGGLGFGAGAAIGGGLVRAIF
ncbi:hypothetical protein FRC12_003955 [Ceratobasidium sp. 428]|nr:hypothetical protein FRC12_003955 [Ceratobasidium sp. 428]